MEEETYAKTEEEKEEDEGQVQVNLLPSSDDPSKSSRSFSPALFDVQLMLLQEKRLFRNF